MSQLRGMWSQVQSSLWFLPGLLTAASAALAFGMVNLDRAGVLSTREAWFLFGAGAEGARGVLSTIAGSIITVTGVVFSITIVVLQLASSQFTPRVLQSFIEDRVNQLVLGVFIGTFTYSLLVLRTVRSSFEDTDRFVPILSVTLAVVLALVSIGFLIYFINHVARSIQAEVILDRAAANARRVVDELFPEGLGRPLHEQGSVAPARGAEAVALVRVQRAGYLQAVDEDRILSLAERKDLVVCMEARIGEFLLPGTPVFSVTPAATPDAVLKTLLGLVRLGAERTRHQDLQRSLVELTDIGVRALSPSLNDPTTAVVSIDRLTEVLARLTAREFPPLERAGEDGRVRFVARRATFAEILETTYAPLIHHSAREPVVQRRLTETLRELLERAPRNRRAAFEAQLRSIEQAPHNDDRASLRSATTR